MNTIVLFSTKMVGTKEQGLLFSNINPITISVRTLNRVPENWLDILDNDKFDFLIEQAKGKRILKKAVSDFKKNKSFGKLAKDYEDELEKIILQCIDASSYGNYELNYYKCNVVEGVFALKALESPDDSYVFRILNSIVPAICENEEIKLSSVERIVLALHDKDVSNEKYHKDLILADQKDLDEWKKIAVLPQNVILNVIFFKHQVNQIVQILKTPSPQYNVNEEVVNCVESQKKMHKAYVDDLVTKEYERLIQS